MKQLTRNVHIRLRQAEELELKLVSVQSLHRNLSVLLADAQNACEYEQCLVEGLRPSLNR